MVNDVGENFYSTFLSFLVCFPAVFGEQLGHMTGTCRVLGIQRHDPSDLIIHAHTLALPMGSGKIDINILDMAVLIGFITDRWGHGA